MKIVDAFWEKRNLGVTCQEVIIEDDDTAGTVKTEISDVNAEYIVVKVPAGKTDVMFLLSELGYRFIECAFHLTHDLKRHALSVTGPVKRLLTAVEYCPMEKADFDLLFMEIKKGLFNTDRIFLDPCFTKEQAANRYVGWISDEFARGADLYKLIYKDKPIGFFTFKDLGDGVYYPFLAGIYEEYKQGGIGLSTLYYPIIEAIKRGGKQIDTYISTNNVIIVRNHVLLNFVFQKTQYIYIKHR
jgi:hypothetical protein